MGGGGAGSAVEANGRMFVDPSPELFEALLQFLRGRQRTNLDLVGRHALLNECNYFGCEWLAQILRGEISPYNIKGPSRSIGQKERDALADARRTG